MMTVREALKHGQQVLSQHIDRPDLEARIFVADAVGCAPAHLFAHPEQELTTAQQQQVDKALAARASGTPLAYVRGRQEFFGREWIVQPGVLIPRPATELLITAALHAPSRVHRVADIGSGSGCIACTLALEKPNWQVIAIDPSPIAREVTTKNRDRWHLQTRVTVNNGDLLSGLHPLPELIVANLPYLRPEQLSEKTIQSEPLVALDGGEDGLTLIRRLVDQIDVSQQRPVGCILECDPSQALAVQDLVLEQLHPKHHQLLGEESAYYGLAAWWA